jgi:hypothetical protein
VVDEWNMSMEYWWNNTANCKQKNPGGKKPVPVAIYSLQIPHGLQWRQESSFAKGDSSTAGHRFPRAIGILA